MRTSCLLAAIALLPSFGLAGLQPQAAPSNARPERIQLKLDISEAEAVLAILDKRSAQSAITDTDWQGLFATEPYIRLKKREATMHRDFTDDDFKKFVLSADLAARASALRHTLDAWQKAGMPVVKQGAVK